MEKPQVPDFDTTYAYLAHYAERQPDAEAIVSGDDRVTYSDLKGRVDRCARAMMGAGIAPGDRLAYLSPPHPDYLVMLLATLAIGAIAVGVNPRYRPREIRHIIADSSPRMLFSRSRMGPRSYDDEIGEAEGDVQRLIVFARDPVQQGAESFADFAARGDAIAQDELEKRIAATDPDSPCLIIYTSGTTGAPKGALLRQRAAVRHGKLYLDRFYPYPLRQINFYPTNHVAGTVANTLLNLVGGGMSFCMEKFDPGEALSIVEREKITSWGGIPTMLQMSVAHETFETTDLSSVQVVNWGGGMIDVELARRLAERIPRLATLYAMTETTGGVTAIDSESDPDVETLCRSVGKPLADVETSVIDEDGSDVEGGTVGELLLRGDFLMTGYWNRPEATAEALDSEGWFHTGDLVRIDDEGRIELVGRRTEMFKSGGYNVYPKEVEDVLESQATVANAVVVSTEDPLFGEVGVAYIRTEKNAAITEDELLEHCREHLANYKVPKLVVIMPSLPMLPNGKFDRKGLSNQAAEDYRSCQ